MISRTTDRVFLRMGEKHDDEAIYDGVQGEALKQAPGRGHATTWSRFTASLHANNYA